EPAEAPPDALPGPGEVDDELEVAGGAAARRPAIRREAAGEVEGAPVLAHDQGEEALDPLLPGPLDEPLQERRPDAAALPVVDDGERDLGLRGLGPAHEPGDADRLAASGVVG